MTRIIHVAGHAGSGKSVIALNLASALHQRGKSVILVDGNLHAPALDHYADLGAEAYLNDYLAGRNTLEEVMHLHSSGVTIIPGALEEPVPKIGEMNRLLVELIGKADIVLVDAFSHAPGLFSLAHPADDVLFVTHDDMHHVLHSKEMIRAMEMKGIPVTAVIVNRKRGKSDAGQIQAVLGKRVIAHLPHDERIIDAADEGDVVGLRYPRSPMARSLGELARMLG